MYFANPTILTVNPSDTVVELKSILMHQFTGETVNIYLCIVILLTFKSAVCPFPFLSQATLSFRSFSWQEFKPQYLWKMAIKPQQSSAHFLNTTEFAER